jgi:hypothetical protein
MRSGRNVRDATPAPAAEVLVGIGDDRARKCLKSACQTPQGFHPALQPQALAASGQAIAAAIVGRDDTAMARLAHMRSSAPSSPPADGPTTLKRALKEVPDEYREADLYYRFEERACR